MQSSSVIPSIPGRREEIAGNTCTGLIKIIAVFFMLIDHSAILFFKSSVWYTDLRLLGRIALPLFAWGCVLGCVYTRSIWRYALRVLLCGFLFQFLYMPVMGHDWTYLNIFFGLSLGILAVGGLREKEPVLRILIPVLCLLLPDAVSALFGASIDYSWKGVLLVVCLYLCRGDRRALAAMFFVFCLFWGSSTQRITSFFGLSLAPLSDFGTLFPSILRLQTGALLALPVILYRPSFSFRVPKWVSYLIYPAHLILLGGIRLLLR